MFPNVSNGGVPPSHLVRTTNAFDILILIRLSDYAEGRQISLREGWVTIKRHLLCQASKMVERISSSIWTRSSSDPIFVAASSRNLVIAGIGIEILLLVLVVYVGNEYGYIVLGNQFVICTRASNLLLFIFFCL